MQLLSMCPMCYKQSTILMVNRIGIKTQIALPNYLSISPISIGYSDVSLCILNSLNLSIFISSL